MTKRSSLALLVLLSVLPGCTTTIVNLTPHELDRSQSGLYPFEAAWDSRQATIQTNSIKASVVIGLNSYPMRRVPLLPNRWETLVPISADQTWVHYCYKFDYQYNRIPEAQWSSLRSPTELLHIVEPYRPPPLPPPPKPAGSP